jgi:tetratricopeptide (TPR) repeat protein
MIVLVMEDLHWIDPSTLEIAQTLVEQAATAPLMLLCTARLEFRAPWPRRAHHTQITLNRLNDRDIREIIASVTTRNTLTEDLIDTVVKRTDGVPLFAEELTRLILGGEGSSVAHKIPATLRDSLTARLDRLGPAKEVAQIAAVIGREFSFELLQAVRVIDEGALQVALQELVGAELIYARGVAPEATYQFKHALIQDAAYEALLKTERRELHLRVAQTITQRLPAVAEEQPELIARHWTEAGARELALTAWKKAAEAAFERRAFKEAEEAYRQALATIKSLPESSERDAQELELVIRFVQVLQATKGWAAPEAADAAAHAQTLAEKTNNLPQLVVQMAGLFAAVVTSADYPTASAVADRVLDLANREGSPACLGTAYACHITVSYFRGDLSGAENHFTVGAAMLAPAGKIFSSALGVGFGYGGHTAWLRGFPDIARERMRLAIAGATELKSPFEQAYTQWLAAKLQLFLRNFELAKTAAAESAALSERHGFRLLAAGATFYLGLAEAGGGHPDSAMPRINLGFRGMEESRALGGMTIFLSWLAVAQALAGKSAEALDTLERALQANPEELYVLPEAQRIRGELRLRRQQTELAEADFRDSLAVARKQGAKSWELRSAMSLAQMLTKRGDRRAARDVLAPVYGWFTEGFDTANLKNARALLEELGHVQERKAIERRLYGPGTRGARLCTRALAGTALAFGVTGESPA